MLRGCPLKLDFSSVVNNIDGTPIKDDKNNNLTLMSAIIIAMTNVIPGDEKLSPQEKFDMGRIAFSASRSEDLCIEDIAKIKERVGKVFANSVVVYSLWNMIEAKDAT